MRSIRTIVVSVEEIRKDADSGGLREVTLSVFCRSYFHVTLSYCMMSTFIVVKKLAANTQLCDD